MSGFRATLSEKYGNMLNAWHAYDPQKRSLIDQEAFVKQCTADGVTGDLVQLFHDLLATSFDHFDTYFSLMLADFTPILAHFGRNHLVSQKTRVPKSFRVAL